ncbi:MAG: DUF116 domain-containing protein [Candidatus Bathyarchaeota archaeon]
MKTWRVIDTGYLKASENMALDDAIIKSLASNISLNTLRFLQFSPPAVLVGYHQAVEHEVRVEFCRRNGIEINRRITGGGAIFLDEKTLGWEVFAKKSDFKSHFRREDLYREICEAVIQGLSVLGVDASFRPKNDIEVKGRKISGTGGTELEDVFLFQGTLLIDFDIETMIKALRIPIVKLKDKELNSAKERITCLKWELNSLPSLKKIKAALKLGFEKILGVKLATGKLVTTERELFNEALGRFRSTDWIYAERRPLSEAVVVKAVDKTKGGLINVSLAVDRRLKIIKNALITGDFFAYPSRAILDLEADLKYTGFHEGEIRKIVCNFFMEKRVKVLDIDPEDFVKVILKAISKTSYGKFGITPAEGNYIYPIAGNGNEILKGGFKHLLLPYCAKLPTCEYRKIEGCIKCGKCTVGLACDLAENSGIKVTTVQNFEHLMMILDSFRGEGVKSYVGCCCEAFYHKHQDDMEEKGIPSVLIAIDNQTCYDLGKEKSALNGDFEGFMELKMDLLNKVIKGKTSRVEVAK